MANYEFSQISGDRPCCRLSRNVQICLGVGLLVLIALVVILVIVLWPRSLLVWNGSPTTKHFPEIFLGRCLVYTQILRPEMRDQDCKKLLGAFKRAFVSKNPCNITTEDYEPLVKMATQTIPCNKSLFWSKSKDLAHKYTWVQGKLFTLEDTLLGYIADDLRWCGDPSTSDMNYESCPHWRDNCPNNPITVYWKVISKKFAEDACGVVQVMLNGSLSEPFHKNSTFGSVEVFNLDPDKVHKLEAWVMHDIETAFSNSCSSSSINELKLIVQKRNITFACQDNYRPVRFVQCVKNPEHSSCHQIYPWFQS
ncbi:ADP-ribosyl cyclase/cyclic ADP-ribose hydrolase 1 [Meriones unguiculatus]|uniref:ADP-ribosyl cyclase/cyclic ADP-ribose hydrolase 1 n=1 Tax=Meriones unguiculatus TaxID=10047 RepID=UPI000B4F314C|nr:ADP-ribosyl cyclase/cyclic ADP-ribose hydrolase 1 [Meriones unguiculatus]